MSEEKAPYHTGGNWQPPDYSSRDFLLEIYLQGHDMAVENATTIGGLLSVVQHLASGSSLTVKGIFNGHLIGAGSYRSLGNELVVVQESGALVGMFAPVASMQESNLRCVKCGNAIIGEPGASPSYDGPLCGSCAWEEWLIDHE